MNRVLAPLGLTLSRRCVDREGFEGYLRRAREAGMDVNDWLERELGWEPALPILEQVLFPHLGDGSVVLELGPGTGRQSRHVAPLVERLILVDNSAWAVEHLRSVFGSAGNVEMHQGDGLTLPLDDGEVDVAYSDGTFIYLKPSVVMAYAREFARVLSPGGVVVLDYIDPETEGGWDFLAGASRTEQADYYTCFTRALLDAIFAEHGLVPQARQQLGKSTYVVYRKPSGAEDRL